jgi:DNA-binding transcriptional MerR regulator
MPRGHTTRGARLITDSPSDAAIPDKLYFRIGEVSRLTKTKAFVLRYWETEFPSLRPVKSKTGHRLYRRKDVELIFKIRQLLYQVGFTIDGARKHMANGAKDPAAQPLLFQPLVGTAELKAIRRELQTVLTILSRKC